MTQQLSFDRPHIASDEVRRALASDPADVQALANHQAANAISDLGVLALADGNVQQAVARFQQALRLDATAQAGFHNLLAALLNANHLRGANFDTLRSHLLEHWNDLDWRDAYIPLLVQPKFLNLEFVSGKCNLKCRMCIGVNAASHPNKLSFIDVNEIAAMLAAAPTITGITLSSGDSDPLLHPQFADVLNVAAQHNVRVDLYTNGLPLSAKTARTIATGGAVSMINVSIDAAMAETYARIRGGDFEKVIRNLGMLTEMRNEAGTQQPLISTSFVAMRDNVHELPEFVRTVYGLGANQVIVDDLSGWRDAGNGNEPATAADGCAGYLGRAQSMARELGVRISFHERLQRVLDDAKRQASVDADGQKDSDWPDNGSGDSLDIASDANVNSGGIAVHLHGVVQSLLKEMGEPRVDAVPQPQRGGGTRTSGAIGDEYGHVDSVGSEQAAKNKLACCGWIDGVWVGGDGALHPCCMVRSPVDMGRIDDGPLLDNERYLNVKRELLAGKVFHACTTQRMCAFVQQEIADGRPFSYIDETTRDTSDAPCEQLESRDSILALPILS